MSVFQCTSCFHKKVCEECPGESSITKPCTLYVRAENLLLGDRMKCKSIGCQFYDEKMEFNCCANEDLCEKCMNNQHFLSQQQVQSDVEIRRETK